jgi:tRNA(Ile)-lysidine synthase
MIDRFRSNLESRNLLPEHSRIILCVSGGLDSIVMADMFIKSGYRTGIAHVNFGLRGSDSIKDEDFVRQFAERNQLDFHLKNASPEMKELRSGVSVQMAARQIRYEWFNHLLSNIPYDYAATAHHADDQAETFLINLNRGSGFRGLSGYEFLKGAYVKPLLEFTRSEIQHYAEKEGLVWREDLSNKEDYYLRNKIRHLIIPGFRNVFPDFSKKFIETFRRLKRERYLLEYLSAQAFKKIAIRTNSGLEIDATQLLQFPDPAQLLFEFLRDMGFSMHDCEAMAKNLTSINGQVFFAGSWRARLERNIILIYRYLDNNILNEPRLNVEEIQGNQMLPDKFLPSEAWIDLDKVKGSLYLKRWEKGDQFWPSGMQGRKLISDFLRDKHVSSVEKQAQYLLMCEDEVVWVVNHRIDKRFAADRDSRRMVRITIEPNLAR